MRPQQTLDRELVGKSENNQIQSTEPGGYFRQKGNNMSNIKVGDRVAVTHENDAHCMKKGMTGTVKYISSSFGKVAVEFDKPFVHGHSCNGTTAPYRGQWMYVCDLKVLNGEGKEKQGKTFKIGDKVRVVDQSAKPFLNPVSNVGTVAAMEFTDGRLTVRFVNGSCRQFIRFRPEQLELVGSKHSPNWKIVIIPDGDKTTATLYNGKKAERSAAVQRYHKDKYDTFIAADEAIKKLFGKQEKPEPEKPKRFTGRAVCKAPITGFTVGKIYSFKDGFCVDDKGVKRPDFNLPHADLDKAFETWMENQFVKIKE